MKRASLQHVGRVCPAVLLLGLATAMGADPQPPAPPVPPPPMAKKAAPTPAAASGAVTRLADGTVRPNADIFVHKVQVLTEGAEAVSWSPSGNRVLVTRRGVDQYYSVYSVSTDGQRRENLTLNMAKEARHLHDGDPSWHPSGDYFAFISQNQGSGTYERSRPGMGLNCNLWLGTRDGTTFWKLSNIPTSTARPQGVTYPFFAPDGGRLCWSGNTGRVGAQYAWGEKALYVADFRLVGGVPQLGSPKTHQPGERKDFYETHGFSPDGKQLLFSANLAKDQPLYGIDLCLLDLTTGKLTRLTNSPTIWDEFGAFSPDGSKIVWMTNTGLGVQVRAFGTMDYQKYLSSELWIMNADGSEPKQLTFFNTPGFPEHTGRRCFVANSCWSPDGRQIAVCVHFEVGSDKLAAKALILDLGVGPAADFGPKGTEPEKAPPPPKDDRKPRPASSTLPSRF